MMDNIKEQLNSTDDEWEVLQPKIEKVMTAQRQMRAGGMGLLFRRNNNGGGGGGGGRGFGANDDSPVAKATQDLRDTLDNKDATADTITQKLTALRDARTKAQTDLTAAQKDLKDVLTQRQEASLVMLGILE
jgi:prefoldin subunit 5